jgi:pyrrolidone-carboxylate peptidase
MRILVTAFKPFRAGGNLHTNTSELIAKAVSGYDPTAPSGEFRFLSKGSGLEAPLKHHIVFSPEWLFDVTFSSADKAVQKIQTFVNQNPDIEAVVCMGQGSEYNSFHVEKFAQNHSGDEPDMAGVRKSGRICAQAPHEQLIESGLPVDHMGSTPNASVNYSPTNYLCNYLFYKVARGVSCRVGFVHCPLNLYKGCNKTMESLLDKIVSGDQRARSNVAQMY